MTKSKWIMKQYWRVGTIRAVLSLILGMLVIGKFYSEFIPELKAMGLVGALILSFILIFVFLGIGWWYDEKVKLWNESVQVGLERNPYSYIPDFRSLAIEYPFAYTLFNQLKELNIKHKLNISSLEPIIVYLNDFFKRSPDRRGDLFSAPSKSKDFLEDHPFVGDSPESTTKIGLGSKLKKRFQLEILRLHYVQSFSGLFQDVLVFGALYTTLLFPEFVMDTEYGVIVPLNYLLIGILFISMPLYITLTIGGWYYDKKLAMWSPAQIVEIERSPYSYVPDPRMYAILQPIFYTLFGIFRQLFICKGMETKDIDKIIAYLHNYLQLHVSRDEDMVRARQMRNELGDIFMPLNPDD